MIKILLLVAFSSTQYFSPENQEGKEGAVGIIG